MSNGNEYNLLWDEDKYTSEFVKMIDIQKGWVELNEKFISEITSVGVLDKNASVSGKAKAEIVEQYGKEVFLEEGDNHGMW